MKDTIEMFNINWVTMEADMTAGSRCAGARLQRRCAALQEMWGRAPANKTKVRKLTIKEARAIIHDEEADKLLDQDAIVQEALDRAQNDGIVFVD